MRKRLFLLLAFGLVLAQATVVTSFLQCQSCGSGDDDCQSGCETCVCCSMSRVDVPPPTGDCALNPVGTVLASPTPTQQPAYPQDIFHVPRLSLS